MLVRFFFLSHSKIKSTLRKIFVSYASILRYIATFRNAYKALKGMCSYLFIMCAIIRRKCNAYLECFVRAEYNSS